MRKSIVLKKFSLCYKIMKIDRNLFGNRKGFLIFARLNKLHNRKVDMTSNPAQSSLKLLPGKT